MSTRLQPARTNFSTTSMDALKVNPEESQRLDFRPKKVAPFQKSQKKNKQAVASFISKTIKSSLDDEMLNLIESYNSVRLTSLIRNSFKIDHLLEISNGKIDLEQFDFNTSSTFKKTVRFKFFVKGGSHSGYAILHVPAFVPETDLNVPDEATNFKISARLVSISDFKFSKDLKAYVPENIGSHGDYGSFETTMLPVLKMQTQPITSQVCINKCKPLEDGVHTLLLVAVKFYNYQKGKFIHLSDRGSMKIMKVF